MKSRIEVNGQGEAYLVLPEEVIQEYFLEEGDVVTWELQDDFVMLTFE
jgi:hypothetical protein